MGQLRRRVVVLGLLVLGTAVALKR
jgi:hypothetical protein